MNVVECTDLTKDYGKTKALDKLSFTIEENKITGLIGRNGAGKTTLLKTMAGYFKATSGNITVFGKEPFNNISVSSNMIFIDDGMDMPEILSLAEILTEASVFYKNWDMNIAMGLFNYFGFKSKDRYRNLSKGMRSTFNMIIGISARAALTIFDEPTTGMDVAVRKDFYRALLKDYIKYPRTIILSSHLLNEIEDIIEDILLIKDGQLCVHRAIADFKETSIGLRGNSDIVEQLTKGKEIYHREDFGKNGVYKVIKKDLKEGELERLINQGVEILPVATEDLCVYLTSKFRGGIDDVFDRC